MTNKPQLTSAEMGKLWATYLGNTMSQCVLGYYLNNVEDKETTDILQFALNLSDSIVRDIKDIFERENFAVPVGFTKDDVNMDAPRLFEDAFYLHYLKYAGKAGISLYSLAIFMVSREDIREFVTETLSSTVKLMNKINATLLNKGRLMDPPPIPIPKKVDFIKKQNYLNGYLGNERSLHGLEIGHLYECLQNDITSKALIIGFAQVAQDTDVRNFFKRGKKINQRHIDLCSQKLDQASLPSPSLIDHYVTTSTEAPFSDKLMLAHKIDMFSMKIRSYANGASLNGRRDVGLVYGRMLADVGLYVEDGANIMIDHGWMEQPPKAVNRNHLTSE
ncbi:DUF3231 family protein [Virgibacillus kekensis]|uniref:DUF3231 family protein n=1 Tax=Virgibacillus kekensis TaxID=202261 RepID=A0ABV9DNW1_9BACI